MIGSQLGMAFFWLFAGGGYCIAGPRVAWANFSWLPLHALPFSSWEILMPFQEKGHTALLCLTSLDSVSSLSSSRPFSTLPLLASSHPDHLVLLAAGVHVLLPSAPLHFRRPLISCGPACVCWAFRTLEISPCIASSAVLYRVALRLWELVPTGLPLGGPSPSRSSSSEEQAPPPAARSTASSLSKNSFRYLHHPIHWLGMHLSWIGKQHSCS
jgi:hypothetical protein